MMNNEHANVRIPPPLIVLGLLAAGFALDSRLITPKLNALPAALVGLFLGLGGFGIGLMAIGLFRRAGTNPEPWRPSSVLVTEGIYRVSRNPMYLGMMFVAAGLSLAAGGMWSAISLAAIFAALNLYVIKREEAYLNQRFGAGYAHYRSLTRRWL
ncbi:MAG: isoprenylcysteine carboxylmethyltransferase family protein [Sphingomicrobium sp.]